MTLNVFVYGTLKPGGRYHAAYCREHLLEAVPAIAPGILYHLPHPHHYPAMTQGDRPVRGFLLRFSNNTVLSKLDALEDYDPNRATKDNLYDRRLITTQITPPLPNTNSSVPTQKEAQTVLAWAYFMESDTVRALGGIQVESNNWNAADFAR